MVEKNKETLSLDGRGDGVDNTINYLNKWQPIETAPSNKAVLLHQPDPSGSHSGWIFIGINRKDRWYQLPSRECYPTHWMPLPEPPEVKK